MDNDNPWCSIADEFFGKLGDLQMKYEEMDWPESAVKEDAALDAGLKEHIRNCAQCSSRGGRARADLLLLTQLGP